MMLVLDSCALIALLKREPGGELVDSLLTDKANTCLAHALNLCEVYYDVARRAGKTRARDTINRLIMAGVYVREDMDTDFWQEVGNLKTDHNVSLADCVCMALANRLGLELITSDRHEMEPLAAAGVCRVRFIR